MALNRVLIDGRLMTSVPNGISRYTSELILAYKAIYPKSEILLLCRPGVEVSEQGVTKLVTSVRPFSLINYVYIPRVLNANCPDIFHVPFYFSGQLFRSKIYTVVTVHDLMFRIVPSFFGESRILKFLKKGYFDFIVGRTLKACDEVISVSKTTQMDVKRLYSRRSTLVPNCIAETSFSDVGGQAKPMRFEGLSSREFFLYVGNQRPHKGLGVLFKAYEGVNTTYKLVLVTSNTNRNYSHKKSNMCIFFSDLSNDELSWLYRNCISVVVPSLYEGFGFPILEALRFGAKIVASDGGALSEFESPLITFFQAGDVHGLQDALDIARIAPADEECHPAGHIPPKYTRKRFRKALSDALIHIESKGLFFAYDDSPVWGGHQVMAKNILAEVSKSRRVLLFTSNRDKYEALDLPETMRIVPVGAEKGPFTILRSMSPLRIMPLLELFLRFRVKNLLVLQGTAEMGVSGLVASKLLGIRAATYIPMCATPEKMSVRFPKVRTYLQNKVLTSFDCIFTISEGQVEGFTERGLKNPKHVIPNHLGRPFRPKEIYAGFSRTNASGHILVVSCVGRVDFQQKNQIALIEMSQKLLAIGQAHRINIVGDGPDLSALKQQVRSKSLVNQFFFLGWLSRTEDIYHGIDAVVSVSNYEGVPLSMIESLQRGVAFFAPSVCEYKEFIHKRLQYSSYMDLACKLKNFKSLRSIEKEEIANFGLDRVEEYTGSRAFENAVSNLVAVQMQ